MPTVAQRWAAWEWAGKRLGRSWASAGTPPGTPILQSQFGQLLWISVQIAWGATPTSDMSTWAWTDVTRDVKYDSKIVIVMGRQDESTTPQPATLTVTLDNQQAQYSYGPQSPTYPNITKNVPVRVVVTYQGISYVRFIGYSTGFSPVWDSTGRYAVVKLVAAGAKRRLNKGTIPVKSVLARSVPDQPNLVEYWPMEDGTASTSIASGIGASTMQLGNGIAPGLPNLASSTSIASSNAIPTLATGSLFGPVDATQMTTGTFQVRFMAVWPVAASAAADKSEILSINTPGSSIGFWWFLYHTGGGLSVQGYSNAGSLLFDSGTIGFNVDGTKALVSLSLVQSGSDIHGQIQTYVINAGASGGATFTATSQTLNPCTAICFAPNGDQANLAVGHCTVSNQYLDIFNLQFQVNGYLGEYTGNRLDRLSTENGEHLTRLVGSTQQLMGVQSPDTYINLMEGIAKVENGVLCDGINQGMTFISHNERASQPAAITLDASLGQVVPELAPVDDDQQTINIYTASQTSGSSYTYSDTTDALATTTIGTYSDSTTQNYYGITQQLADAASWAVHVGTVTGYRWPTVHMWMHLHPEILQAWLNTKLQNRIDITNLHAVRKQLYNATVSLLMEGYTETIDQFTWEVEANATSYDPWRVGEIAQETGDTNEFVFRVETDGSSVVGTTAIGSSSISVSSVDTVWTTLADDFPFYANIGGQQIKVTNITGSTSPQTFTVDPTTVLYTIPNNAPVSLWNPTYIDVLAM